MAIKSVFITTVGTSTYTIPADFLSLTSVEAIGGGGGATTTSSNGGGGAYAASTAITGLVASGTAFYRVGINNGTTGAGGTARSWFNTTNAEPTSSTTGVLAQGGSSSAINTAGVGGASGSCIGTTVFSGGNGAAGGVGGGGGAGGPGGAGGTGSVTFAATSGRGGGGGGASLSAAGSAGGAASGAAGGAGGNGGGGTGGGAGGTSASNNGVAGTAGTGGGGGGAFNTSAGGTTPGGAGGTGNYWTQSSNRATAGSGGGGGASPGGVAGASGGLYGGGGGTGSGTLLSQGAQGIVVFTYASTATTLYWVGGAGTWNTTSATNWSDTSGGTGGFGVPTSIDNVIIDANSGTGNITTTAGVCNNLTVTASQAITLGFGSSLSIYGSLSFPSGGSFTNGGGGSIIFAATSTGKTITTNGKTLITTTFNGVGGGWTLQDNLSMQSANLTLTNGSFNANNFNVNCGSFSSSNSNTRTLTMGSGTWTLSDFGTVWSTTTTTGLTFNTGTSTIALSNTSTTYKEFRGGGLTYNNLSITGATGIAAYIFTGANTFNQISSSKTVAYTITLPSSTTTTVTTWSASGLVSNLLTLNSSTSGTAATLAVTNTFTVNYGTIQDVNMSATLRGTATNSTVINSNNWQIATTSTRWLNPLITAGSGTVTTPSDWPTTAVTDIYVIGGGGGAAGGVTTNLAGGAGGGGGGYAKAASTTLAASTAYSYTVGAGGAGSAGGATNQTGGTGGTTSFAVTPISYVSSAVSVQNTASTTISVTVPSVSNGNLMVMIVQSTSNGATWTTPSGWTASSAGTSKAIFYKTASSEPASYTVTQSASTTSDAFIIAYSNATFNTAGAIGGNATPAQPATITVAQPNSTIVYYVGRDSAVSVTFTTPTGYTARQADSDATAPSAALFDLANVAAGSYTAPTSTPSSGTAAAVVIALSPTGAVSATGGAGGASTTTPTSTGGAGGVGSGGTPIYVAQSTAVQNTNSTTITVNVPTGTADGDLLILMVMSSSGIWTTPSGWTVWLASANNRAIYYRTASSEPASYTITQGSSTTASACMLAYRNAAIDVMGTITAGNTSPNTATAITTTANNTIVFDYVASNDASLTFSTPSGYTSLASDSDATSPSYALFYKTQATAGTTGTAATTFASGTARSILFAIKSTATVYTGGTGGAGATSGTKRAGGGGGGAAGLNGNGGNGGVGFNGATSGGGGGGGNGGGTAGAAGTDAVGGTGGNNSLGTGGGTSNNAGTLGGGGGGSRNGNPGTAGGNGIDIISVLSVGSGGGAGGAGYNFNAGANGGLYGGGGSGACVDGVSARAGGTGAQGAIFISSPGTYVPSVSTGNFFFLFM